MLALILCRISFNKSNMSTHFITIVTEVNKFTDLIIRMRLMGSKNSNNRVCTDTIECVSIAGDDTLQSMVLQNVFLKGLFVFGFASHR